MLVTTTYATEFAAGLLRIVESNPGYGTYHCSAAGSCSWFEFTQAILAAATSPTARTATLAARTAVADRTVADAQAMGITGVVGSYYTTYGGIPSRLHNVALVA